jgi:hypothetical protein
VELRSILAQAEVPGPGPGIVGGPPRTVEEVDLLTTHLEAALHQLQATRAQMADKTPPTGASEENDRPSDESDA